MPKLGGIFNYLDGLAEMPLEGVARWLKSVPSKILLENFIGNRVLYPQTIPVSEYDMDVDMAIVRESLRLGKMKQIAGQKTLIDQTARRIYIPEDFVHRIPNLLQLIIFFVDAYILPRQKKNISEDIWTVTLQGSSNKTIGTIVIPVFHNNNGVAILSLNNKKYQIKKGIITILPCKTNRCHMDFKIADGKMLGVSEGVIEVYGGDVGVIVDARGINNE